MAGTLTISTLSDGTNSTSSTNCIQGSAKAWVNYKGTATRAINASYNVSSVTFNSTGYYTVNFTNAFADANYSAICTRQRSDVNGICTPDTITTSSFGIRTAIATSAILEDATYVFAAVFR
jgi:hypothetical protein